LRSGASVAAAVVKTGKKETMTLTKMLVVGLISAVWVPPHHVRELRALINHRQRLICHRTRPTKLLTWLDIRFFPIYPT
jgi:hypothetical protein